MPDAFTTDEMGVALKFYAMRRGRTSPWQPAERKPAARQSDAPRGLLVEAEAMFNTPASLRCYFTPLVALAVQHYSINPASLLASTPKAKATVAADSFRAAGKELRGKCQC